MENVEQTAEQIELSEYEFHFVKIYSLEEYGFWNVLFSQGRNYPVNSGTESYAPSEPEAHTEELEGEQVIYYKFPLSLEIMAIMAVLKDQIIYKPDGSRLFGEPLK